MKHQLPIPIEGSELQLFNKSNTLLSNGYQRVVIGKRGPYVECSDLQINKQALYIPKNQKYRLTDPAIYYHEYRTNDFAYTKVYYQLHTVKYADYKVGYYYFSPDDLKVAYEGEEEENKLFTMLNSVSIY
jgi:hypothetical protein